MAKKLHTELLITAGVEGLSRIDSMIESLQQAGHDTDQLAEEAAKLRDEWDSLSAEDQARRIRNLGNALNEASEDADRLADNTEQNVGAFNRLKKAALALGAALGVTFVAGKIASFFGAATSDAAEFEAQLSTVKAVSGATAQEMEQLRIAAEVMGASTKYNATEAAQALENLSRAGLNATESIEALPSVLSLAQGNGIELAEAASYVTQAASGMGLSMSEAARVADVLAKAASSANTDIQGMGSALAYAAPTAASLGLSLEETAAYIGKFADAGIDGSRAGTSLNNMLAQFANPASTLKRELAAIGIRTNNFNQAIRELAAAGAQGEGAINALGMEAGPAFKALIGQGISSLDELTQKLQSASGFATAQAKEMGNNAKGALAELGSAWDALKLKLAAPLLEPLKAKMQELAALISKMVDSGKITELGNRIAAVFKNAADAVIRFVEKLDFEKEIDKLAGGFERLQSIGKGVNGAFQALSIIVNGLKSGFAALGYVVVEVVDLVAKAGLGLIGIGAMVTDFLGISDNAVDSIVNKLNGLNDATENARQALAEVIHNSGESIRESGRSIAGIAEEAAMQAGQSLASIPQEMADILKDSSRSVAQTLKEMGVDAHSSAEAVNAAIAQILAADNSDAMRLEVKTALIETGNLQLLNAENAKRLNEEVAQSAIEAQNKQQNQAKANIDALEAHAQAAKNAIKDIGLDLDEIMSGVSAGTQKAMSDYTYALEQAAAGGLEVSKIARAGFEKLAEQMSSPEAWQALQQHLQDSGMAMAMLSDNQIKRLKDGIKGIPNTATTAMQDLSDTLAKADVDGIEKLGKQAKTAFADGELSAAQYQTILNQIEQKTLALSQTTQSGGEIASRAHQKAATAAQQRAAAEAKAAQTQSPKTEAQEERNTANKEKRSRRVVVANNEVKQSQEAVSQAVKDTAEESRRTAEAMLQMAASAKNTADSIAASLAELRGDSGAQERLQQEQKINELQAKMLEAQQSGNAEAARQYQRAIGLQKQLYQEKQIKAQEQAAVRAQQDKSAPGNNTATRQQSSNGSGLTVEAVADAWSEQIKAAEQRGAENFMRGLYESAKRRAQ